MMNEEGHPVAWSLRMWLIRLLAGRQCVAMNLSVEDGILYASSRCILLSNVRVSSVEHDTTGAITIKS